MDEQSAIVTEPFYLDPVMKGVESLRDPLLFQDVQREELCVYVVRVRSSVLLLVVKVFDFSQSMGTQ